jgi:hypothetical protein
MERAAAILDLEVEERLDRMIYQVKMAGYRNKDRFYSRRLVHQRICQEKMLVGSRIIETFSSA